VTASQLLREAKRRGITLSIDAGSLRYHAPAGSLSDLRGKLVASKPNILAILNAPGEHDVCFYFCGNPLKDSHCRKCGGTWNDYVRHLTGRRT
jgi:hypothetical protein